MSIAFLVAGEQAQASIRARLVHVLVAVAVVVVVSGWPSVHAGNLSGDDHHHHVHHGHGVHDETSTHTDSRALWW